jgi:2-amino-4-hydroxy-6-hydroxymethyldihydropteridine diphosphokinase
MSKEKDFVYLLLGANLGQKEANIRQAVDLIGQTAGKVMQHSSFYLTEPWGEKDQDEFLNLALAIDTKLSPLALLEKIQKIELIIGRSNTYTWGPREIDIDILLYRDMIYPEFIEPFLFEDNFDGGSDSFTTEPLERLDSFDDEYDSSIDFDDEAANFEDDFDQPISRNEDSESQNLDLCLPHPQMHLRRFSLVPLAEIAPNAIHPTIGLSIDELLKTLQDDCQVTLFKPF